MFWPIKIALFTGILLISESSLAQVTFRITDLPRDQVEDSTSTYYLLLRDGTFANGEQSLAMSKDSLGNFIATFQNAPSTFYYKFSRGGWPLAEGDINGLPIPFRLYQLRNDLPVVDHQVVRWQQIDLVIGLQFYMLITSIVFSLLFIGGILYLTERPNYLFTIVIAFFPIVVLLFTGILIRSTDAFIWNSVLQKTSSTINSLIAIMVLLYAYRSVNFIYYDQIRWKKYVAILFFVSALFIQIQMWLPHKVISWHAITSSFSVIAEVSNLILCLTILVVCRSNKRFIGRNRLIISVMNYSLVFITAWIFLKLFSQPTPTFYRLSIYAEFTIFLWFLFLVLAGIYLYVPAVVSKELSTKKHDRGEEYIGIKRKLEELMYVKKVYRNPTLDLPGLSGKLGVSRNELSRLLNGSYEQNFNDFINQARIDEFVNFFLTDNYHDYTYQYVAEKVGFNSKSAFQRAFKKMKGCTPSDFFKRNEILRK